MVWVAAVASVYPRAQEMKTIYAYFAFDRIRLATTQYKGETDICSLCSSHNTKLTEVAGIPNTSSSMSETTCLHGGGYSRTSPRCFPEQLLQSVEER
jgi:hypothetical protein